MTRFIYDGGNSRIKWHLPGIPEYGDFMHALAELTESDWKRAVGAGKPPRGLIRVNGIPYAVGDAARRHVLKNKPKGAARYRADYYGVLLCRALSNAFEESDVINLFASYAPQDHMHVPALIKSAKQPWCVESYRGSQTFEIKTVTALDEPLCGYAHRVWTKRGDIRPDNPFAGKTVLIIDIGGGTTDTAVVDPDGEIDMLSLHSDRHGTIDVIKQFEDDLRSNNAERFQMAGDLDIRRVESAIITGVYQFGRIEIDCRHEAKEALRSLVNAIVQIINTAGGAANFDVAGLTGGGPALVYETLVAAFPDLEFVMVEEDRDLMKYANVFGAAKIATLIGKA